MKVARLKTLNEPLQAAMYRAIELSEWFQKELHETSEIEHGHREFVTLGYASLALEHREAILLLVGTGANATAMAATRSVLEALALSLWARELATPADLTAFLAQRLDPPSVDRIMKRLSKSLRPHGAVFDVLGRHYSVLNDYAHGGLKQISRWLHPGEIAPRYGDDQMIEILRFVDVVGLMAAIVRANVCEVAAEPYMDRLDQLLQTPMQLQGSTHSDTPTAM